MRCEKQRPAVASVPDVAIDRFWSKVDRGGSVPSARPELGPCWIWTGSAASQGYGQFSVGSVVWSAHRFACELAHGPIPRGLVVDHLCFARRCVNPGHLEAVTEQVNITRSLPTGERKAAAVAARAAGLQAWRERSREVA